MYGRRKSGLTTAFLLFLAFMYGIAVRLRSFAYRLRILPTRKLPYRIVSIGNLTLGGTGKTPTVISVAGLFLNRGLSPVILSRGYGRVNDSEMHLLSSGTADVSHADIVGDEPALIKSRLPQVTVIVGKDRYRAGMLAQEKLQPKIGLLDDGYQHRRLKRDVDILLIDARDPFGNGKLFPAGILREPLGALRRADAVLITRTDEVGAGEQERIRSIVRQFTAAPVFHGHTIPIDLVDVASGEQKPLAALRGTPVLSFSGIARPAALAALLERLGAVVKAAVPFPDHHRYSKSDLATLFQRTVDCGAVMVITTEKDAVKLKGMTPEGIWALRISMEIRERDAWEKLLLSNT